MSPATGRFRRSDRLLVSRDFRRVSSSARRTTNREFVVLVADRDPALSDGNSAPRLGIAASRKVGNAVVRNRLKRLVREWFRHERDTLPRNADIVVIARRAAADVPGREILDSLSALGRRAGARS